MNAPIPQLKAGVILRPDRCEKCKFHELYPANRDHLECRRHPPQRSAFAVPGPNGNGFAIQETAAYPKVQKFGWCGEFKPRIEGLN